MGQAFGLVVEALELRRLLAAHIVGSPTSYSTIQAAVNAASAGATITVDAGTYQEEVSISKSLTIQGAQAGVDARNGRTGDGGNGETIVDGALITGGRSAAFYINADDVTIDGFTVQGETNQDTQLGAGIVIGANHHGTHIINDIVQNNVSGLFLSNNSSTDAALIQYDVFQNNNNNGSNGGRGIYTDQTIFGSLLTNVTIDSNLFVNNHGATGTTGVEAACAFESSVAGEQTNIRITNNTMTDNGKAVLIFNASNVVIEYNTATQQQDQYSGTFRFEGNVQNATIEYNTVDNNTGPAVAVDSKATVGDSSGFVVNDNNFFGNNDAYSVPLSVVFDPLAYSGAFDARNNWWGSASGPSIDGLGTGDGASAGQFQTNLGWSIVAGGNLLYSPWATAPVLEPGQIPTAPTGLSAVASGPTEVTLNWTDTDGGLESGFIVQRSSNGISFSQVGSVGIGITRFIDTTAVGGMNYAYRVAATSSNGNSPFGNMAIAAMPEGGSISTQLSSLNWVSATTGYGTVQKNLSVGGNKLTIGGVTYTSGIGTHAVSQIVYNLGGGYTNFMSDIGVDAEVNGTGTGSVDFVVMGDGKTLYDSGVLSNPQHPVSINVNVNGVQTLTLIANNGVAGTIDYDHADWGGAQLIAPPANGAPMGPSGLTATAVSMGASSSKVNLSWTNNAGNATGFVIQRSIDGVNFKQIGTTSGTLTTYSDTVVLAGQTYIYRVAATNANGMSGFSATASATTLGTAQVTTVLGTGQGTTVLGTGRGSGLGTGLPIRGAGCGTVQDNRSAAGNPITLNGVVHPTGIGTHGVSNIVYNLGGDNTNFVWNIGWDAQENGKGIGLSDLRVIVNGTVAFGSGVRTHHSSMANLGLTGSGVQTATLLATNGVGGSIDDDRADWASARIVS